MCKKLKYYYYTTYSIILPYTQMFRRIFKVTTEKICLGRWECTGMKQNTIKIDWANIDHCGTCTYGSLEKSSETTDTTKESSKLLEAIEPIRLHQKN